MKHPPGTKVRYRDYRSPDDAPMDRVGVVETWGHKWVTIKNDLTSKTEWSKLDGAVPFNERPDKIVVVIDICSSTTILEDLLLTNNLDGLRNLLIEMKRLIEREAPSTGVEIYKFIGDGWILLFPPSIGGTELVNFLETLSGLFKTRLEALVVPRLQDTPAVMGLTFGIDLGPLVRMEMLERIEYIGRSLNVAARLQSTLKESDPSPAYKVLISMPAFTAIGLPPNLWKTSVEKHALRNIRAGNERQCVKLYLKEANADEPAQMQQPVRTRYGEGGLGARSREPSPTEYSFSGLPASRPIIVPKRYGKATTGGNAGYTGLGVVNHGEPAYQVAAASRIELPRFGHLELYVTPSQLLKNDPEMFFPVFIEVSGSRSFAGNLYDFMVQHDLDSITIPVTYRGADETIWYQTDAILIKDQMARSTEDSEGGIRFDWKQKRIAGRPTSAG